MAYAYRTQGDGYLVKHSVSPGPQSRHWESTWTTGPIGNRASHQLKLRSSPVYIAWCFCNETCCGHCVDSDICRHGAVSTGGIGAANGSCGLPPDGEPASPSL